MGPGRGVRFGSGCPGAPFRVGGDGSGSGFSDGGPRCSPPHLDGVDERREAEAAEEGQPESQEHVKERPEHVVPGRLNGAAGGGRARPGGLQRDRHLHLLRLHGGTAGGRERDWSCTALSVGASRDGTGPAQPPAPGNPTGGDPRKSWVRSLGSGFLFPLVSVPARSSRCRTRSGGSKRKKEAAGKRNPSEMRRARRRAASEHVALEPAASFPLGGRVPVPEPVQRTGPDGC